MAELIFRSKAANCALTGGTSVAVPTAEGGLIYVYADQDKGMVASSTEPVPAPAPKPAAKAKNSKKAKAEENVEGDDA